MEPQQQQILRPLSEAFAELAALEAKTEANAAKAKAEARAARKQRLFEALDRGLAKAKADKNTTTVKIGVSGGARAGHAWISTEHYDRELQLLAEEIAETEGLTVQHSRSYQGFSDSEFDYLLFSRRT
jgi:hypothetical protein